MIRFSELAVQFALVVVSVVSFGCTPSEDETADSGIDGAAESDGEVLDAGVPVPDASGPVLSDASDQGNWDASTVSKEGRPCDPRWEPNGECGSDLTCAVWQADDPPLRASCVRKCTQDADCAASTVGNTLCRNLGLRSNPLMICTAEEAVEDESCEGVPLLGTRMRGCVDGLDCLRGVFPDLEPHQGLCAQLCDPSGLDPEAACSRAGYPYCNPKSIVASSTSGAAQIYEGYCADARRSAGAACRWRGLTGQCDADSASGDLRCIPGWIPPLQGTCIEFCNLSAAKPTCAHSDPILGTAQCSDPDQGPACTNDAQCTSIGWERCGSDGFCGILEGLCTLPCSAFPEDCSGAGTSGLGRACRSGLHFDLDNDGNAPELTFCTDVVHPLWTETTLGVDGNNSLAVEMQGDDCATAPERCPDFTTCLEIPVEQVSVCLRGCDSSTSASPRGGCETDATRSDTVCSDILFETPPQGVCVNP